MNFYLRPHGEGAAEFKFNAGAVWFHSPLQSPRRPHRPLVPHHSVASTGARTLRQGVRSLPDTPTPVTAKGSSWLSLNARCKGHLLSLACEDTANEHTFLTQPQPRAPN